MKSLYKNYTACAVALLFFMSACTDDFLMQDPQTSLSTEQVFADLDNIQPFLNGIYYQWRTTRVNRKGMFVMLGNDEAQQGEYQVRTDAVQAGLDKYDGFYYPENTAIAQLWSVRWPVVVLASEALIELQAMKPTAEDSAAIQSYIGQATFYRASVLLELAEYWGALPIPEINEGQITLSGRKSLKETYSFIESDLLLSVSNLQKKVSSDKRIPTIWAAKAMLAKLYMSAPEETGFRNYTKAKQHLLDIKEQGGFNLMSKFADLWDGEKDASSETIYAFYFNNVWPDTNELQWYTGSRACSSNPNCYMGGYDLLLPTVYCYSDASVGGIWDTGDLRKEESIRYSFIYNGQSFSAVSGFGDDQLLPHVKKYEDIRIDGTKSFYNSGKNVYLIRYADVLLMLAECMNEEGSTAEAVDLVNNTVRNRAFGGTLPDNMKWNTGMSQDEFRINILDERMRELCFEGWRRWDLLRTGHFTDYITARNKWAKASGTLTDYHQLFPIPLTEIKTNANLTNEDQNYGY